jgi:hypothetical protein
MVISAGQVAAGQRPGREHARAAHPGAAIDGAARARDGGLWHKAV